MSKLGLPAVSITPRDHRRLLHLGNRAQRDLHPVADALLRELCRAQIIDDRSGEDDIVELNRWVTYRIDWGPSESRVLVHPEDYMSPERQLSVLSPVGAALVGIKVGDRMPFATIEGTFHVVTAVSVDAGPRIVHFGRRGGEDQSVSQDDPNDPGPAAA